MNIKAIEGMKRILLLLAIAVTGVPQELCAQKAAIKTNLVSDAFLNVNLGVETGLAPRWTFDLRGDVNVWTLSNDRRWRHWAVQPEFRYWFCDRFSGHFFGLHTHGGQYSIGGFDGRFNLLGTDARKLKDARFQGWFVGGGGAYGYTWILGLHWNLEMEVGFGYSYTRYDRFRCSGCGKKVETNRPHHYVGPTKAAINLVYVF